MCEPDPKEDVLIKVSEDEIPEWAHGKPILGRLKAIGLMVLLIIILPICFVVDIFNRIRKFGIFNVNFKSFVKDVSWGIVIAYKKLIKTAFFPWEKEKDGDKED